MSQASRTKFLLFLLASFLFFSFIPFTLRAQVPVPTVALTLYSGDPGTSGVLFTNFIGQRFCGLGQVISGTSDGEVNVDTVGRHETFTATLNIPENCGILGGSINFGADDIMTVSLGANVIGTGTYCTSANIPASYLTTGINNFSFDVWDNQWPASPTNTLDLAYSVTVFIQPCQPTDTPTNTDTPTLTSTFTLTYTPTDTLTPTPTFTNTYTSTVTWTPTSTPIPVCNTCDLVTSEDYNTNVAVASGPGSFCFPVHYHYAHNSTITGCQTTTSLNLSAQSALGTYTVSPNVINNIQDFSQTADLTICGPIADPITLTIVSDTNPHCLWNIPLHETLAPLTNTPTNTGTPTFTRTPTSTGTKTFTGTPTGTPTRTGTPTNTFSSTATRTKTSTPTPTRTPTKTPTPTNTLTKTKTGTPTNTATKTWTQTFTPSSTPSKTGTSTFTPTRTATGTYSNTPTLTSTVTNTKTYTWTSTFTPTSTKTFTFTDTFTPTGTFTNTPTRTSTPTSSWTSTFTDSPTVTNTFTPFTTNTRTFTATPTSTFSDTPIPTDTPSSTYTNTPVDTATNTDTPTETATNTAIWTPTDSFTFTPTPIFTNTNTWTPTITDTVTMTPTFTFTPLSVCSVCDMVTSQNYNTNVAVASGPGSFCFPVNYHYAHNSSITGCQTTTTLTLSAQSALGIYSVSPNLINNIQDFSQTAVLDICGPIADPITLTIVSDTNPHCLWNIPLHETLAPPTYTPTKTRTPTSTRTPTPTATFTNTPFGGAPIRSSFYGTTGNEHGPNGQEGTATGNLSVLAAPNISRNGERVGFYIDLDRAATVHLVIFDIEGEVVFKGDYFGNPGRNSLTWNLQNQLSNPVASGLYLYAISAQEGPLVKTAKGKVVVLH